MIKNEVINLLTEYAASERLSRIIENDEKLKKTEELAEELYEKLKNALPEEYKELLESFILEEVERNSRVEFLTYQQGLKDMYNLIMSLQNSQRDDVNDIL